jgi:hypothetical protein
MDPLHNQPYPTRVPTHNDPSREKLQTPFKSLKANAKISWTVLFDFAMRHHNADSKLERVSRPPKKTAKQKIMGTSFSFFGHALLGPLCYLATR